MRTQTMLTKAYESNAQTVFGIRASVLKVVVDALTTANIDAGSALKRNGLTMEPLFEPYNIIPLRNYVAFFEEAAELTGQPSLGIQLGEKILPETLGPVGVLFTMHSSLRMAILRFAHFFPALQGNSRLSLITDAFGTWVDYQIEDRKISPRRQDTEFTFALLTSLTRSRIGRNWVPEEVHFEHSPSSSSREVARFFGTIVRYQQPTNRMILTKADLDKALVGANAPAIAIVERHLIDLIGDHATYNLREAVSLAVQRSMIKGDVKLNRVASQLGLGPRTLQRMLAEEALSFRVIVKEQRLLAAQKLLESKHHSIGAVAAALGYSDAAVLSRAYKLWTGRSPREGVPD